MVGQILAHLDFLDEAIDRLSAEIEERIRPFAAQRDLLMSIPGVKQRTAEVLISEIGVDMSAFPTPKHLASWAKMCPGNDQSAGKRRSGKTGKGSICRIRHMEPYVAPRTMLPSVECGRHCRRSGLPAQHISGGLKALEEREQHGWWRQRPARRFGGPMRRARVASVPCRPRRTCSSSRATRGRAAAR